MPREKAIFKLREMSLYGRDGIVLGHKISSKGIEVDNDKVEAIQSLPPPALIREIQSFLGHVGFYRRFIRDFSKINWPLTRLLEKDTPFNFTVECTDAFEYLTEKLVNAPIMIALDFSLSN